MIALQKLYFCINERMINTPSIVRFRSSLDERGSLTFAEGGTDEIPFEIARVFWISETPPDTWRGDHAHYKSRQVLICMQGEVEVYLEDLDGKKYHFKLDSADQGVYIPELVWGKMQFHDNAIALSLASDKFGEEDYIRDYTHFRSLKNK